MERQMGEGQGDWEQCSACREMVACMEEERERKVVVAACVPEAGGLCGGVDEGRVLCLFVSPVVVEPPASLLPPLGRDVWVP